MRKKTIEINNKLFVNKVNKKLPINSSRSQHISVKNLEWEVVIRKNIYNSYDFHLKTFVYIEEDGSKDASASKISCS